MSALEIGVDIRDRSKVYYPTIDNMRDLVNNQDIHIARLYVNLDATRADSRSEIMTELATVLSNAKDSRLSLLPRFFYTGAGTPPGLNVIQKDMNRILPLLGNWKDQLFGVQAGFLGENWGEWWGAGIVEPDEGSFTTDTGKKKKWIADRWKRFQRETGIVVQFRYPRDHAVYTGDMAGDMAIHDDCMLSRGWDGDDSGTFSKGAVGKWKPDDLNPAKTYMAKVPRYVVAEMCSDTSDFIPTCDLVLKFVRQYKVVGINKEWPSFARAIWQSGRSGGSDQVCSRAIAATMQSNFQVTTAVQSNPQAWQPQTIYQRGDIVIFNFIRYTCLITHLSIPTWSPSIWTQSLWKTV